MSQVRRIYVEKKDGFNIAAKKSFADFRSTLGKSALTDVRILIRYDIEGIDDQSFDAAVGTVFAEPPVDIVYYDTFERHANDAVFAVEYLPGQYDQRADSAAQCCELAVRCRRPIVRCASVYVLSGLEDSDVEDIKKYVINPVDSREASFDLPDTLAETLPEPPDVPVLNGFCTLGENDLREMLSEYALAMSYEDLRFVQGYFCGEEHRDPTLAELRVIDRERLRAPLGRRGVFVVDEVADEREEERRRERRGDGRVDGRDADLA